MLYSVYFAVHFSLLFGKFPLLSCHVQKGYKSSPLEIGTSETREPDGCGTVFELAMDHFGP